MPLPSPPDPLNFGFINQTSAGIFPYWSRRRLITRKNVRYSYVDPDQHVGLISSHCLWSIFRVTAVIHDPPHHNDLMTREHSESVYLCNAKCIWLHELWFHQSNISQDSNPDFWTDPNAWSLPKMYAILLLIQINIQHVAWSVFNLLCIWCQPFSTADHLLTENHRSLIQICIILSLESTSRFISTQLNSTNHPKRRVD